MLRALVAGLGSAEQEAVVADCLRGLHALSADPAGGSEVLAQRLLEAGVAPQLDALWARLLAEARLLPHHEGEGPSGLYLSSPAMALAMALCARLVRLPGLAAALVAFEAPATLAAAAKGFVDACEGGAAAGGPALDVLRACAQDLAGGSTGDGAGAGTPMTLARVGSLAQVASRLLDGLGVQVDTGALLSTAAVQEAVAALADVLACAPAELVEAIDWAGAAPMR